MNGGMEQAPPPLSPQPPHKERQRSSSTSRTRRSTPRKQRGTRRSSSVERRPLRHGYPSANSLGTSRTSHSVPYNARSRAFSSDVEDDLSDVKAFRLEQEKQKLRGVIVPSTTTMGGDDDDDDEENGEATKIINGNVQVIIRVRPPLPNTAEISSPHCVEILPSQTTLLIRDKSEERTFTFDEILPPSINQQHVYKHCVLPLIESSLKYGHNSTVFAYGQTGSGKTYTMMGNGSGPGEGINNAGVIGSASSEEKETLPQHQLNEEEEEIWRDWGIIPRTLRDIFTRLSAEKKRRVSKSGKQRFHYEIELSCVEICGEKLRDLLTPFARNASHASLSNMSSSHITTASSSSNQSPTLKIRESVNGNGDIETEVVGARVISVESYEDAMRHIRRGMRTRVVASTNMNDVSSRSHSITTVNITQWRRRKKKKHHHGVGMMSDLASAPASPNSHEKEKEHVDVRECKIHLVDLAGSESLKRTQAEGKRMKEGININKGLTVLGRVISALGRQNNSDNNKQQLVVPYRDSKLTHLLRGSLGGNHKTLMIACISPSALNQEESLRCLRYATRAKFIENKVETNLSPGGGVNGSHGVDEVTKDEVWGMRLRMKDMEGTILTQKNDMERMQLEMQRLKKRNKDLEVEAEMNKNNAAAAAAAAAADANAKMGATDGNNNGEHEGVNMQEFNEFRNRFQEFEREMNTHVDQMKIMASEMLDLERNTRHNTVTNGHGGLFFNRTLLKVLAQGQTLCPKIVTVMKEVEMQNDADKAQMMEHTIHETFNLPDDIPPSPPQSPMSKDDHTDDHQQQEKEEATESPTQNQHVNDDEVSLLKGELQAIKEERDLLRERLEFQLEKNAMLDEEKYANQQLSGGDAMERNLDYPYLENGGTATTKKKSKHKKKSVPYTDLDSSALVNGVSDRHKHKDPNLLDYSESSELSRDDHDIRRRSTRSKSTDRHTKRRSKSTTRQKKRRSRSETRSSRESYR